jgi:hypothetical protein
LAGAIGGSVREETGVDEGFEKECHEKESFERRDLSGYRRANQRSTPVFALIKCTMHTMDPVI